MPSNGRRLSGYELHAAHYNQQITLIKFTQVISGYNNHFKPQQTCACVRGDVCICLALDRFVLILFHARVTSFRESVRIGRYAWRLVRRGLNARTGSLSDGDLV